MKKTKKMKKLNFKKTSSHNPSIVNRDCKDVAKELNPNDFNGIISQNPYGIIINGTEITKISKTLFKTAKNNQITHTNNGNT